MLISLLGLIVSVLAFQFFSNALNKPVSNNFNLAVILSLLILSGFGVLVFMVLIVLYLWQNASHLRQRFDKLRRTLRSSPQSEFGHEWSNRPDASYEDSRRYSRERGSQTAFRLKWDSQPPAMDGTGRPTARGDRTRNDPATLRSDRGPVPDSTDQNAPGSGY